MPYRRRGTRRGLRSRRRGRRGATAWYNRRYSPMQLARTAWKGVKYLKGLVNAELHKVDVSQSQSNLLNTGVMFHLTPIAQGDGYDTRTGNSIFLRYVNINGLLTFSAGGNVAQTVRFMLICDTQQVGDTAPTVTDVLTSADINSMLNPLTVGRFSILAQRYATVGSGMIERRPFFLRKVMRKHIKYNGTASTDIQKCGIYLLMISDQSSAAGPTVNFTSRVSFYDN